MDSMTLHGTEVSEKVVGRLLIALLEDWGDVVLPPHYSHHARLDHDRRSSVDLGEGSCETRSVVTKEAWTDVIYAFDFVRSSSRRRS